MTANGRSSSSGNVRPLGTLEQDEAGDCDDGSSQAPSGVFRAAGADKKRETRWSLAEQYVQDGFHYRLMRRPLESIENPPRLTKREEAAVALACVGHSNKRIAQALDVSPSTVGVLLFRAAGKLKAKSRSELLSNYEQFKAASGGRISSTDSDTDFNE